MPDDCLLAFDLGTSYFKTAVLDARGETIAFDRTPTPIRRDGPRSEIDPSVFRTTIRDAVHRIGQAASEVLGRVRCVSFCTQANTFVLLDAADLPLTPLIVWNDGRAANSTAALVRPLCDADHRRRSGLPAVSHYSAIAKIDWLARHEPVVFANARRLLFIGDYLTHWFTGAVVIDPGVASLTALFDLQTGRWDAKWCERVRIDPAWLPDIRPAGSAVCEILPAIASELGLSAGCVMRVGLLDQHAGAIGVGNAEPGDVSETTGTVLATIRCGHESVADDPNVFVGPSPWAGRYFHMAFGDVSASLLEHYRQQLPDHPSFESLDAAAAEGAPRLRLDAAAPVEALRSQIRQWASFEPRGDVVACIYHAVADSLRQQTTALIGKASPPSCVRSAGGASRSRRWLQIKADVLGLPVLPPRSSEPTLLGVAAVTGLISLPAAGIDALLLPRPLQY